MMMNNLISLVPQERYYNVCAVFKEENSYLDEYKRILNHKYVMRNCDLIGYGYNPLYSSCFLGDFFNYIPPKDFTLKSVFHFINSRGSPLKEYMYQNDISHLTFNNFIIVINPKDNIILL